MVPLWESHNIRIFYISYESFTPTLVADPYQHIHQIVPLRGAYKSTRYAILHCPRLPLPVSCQDSACRTALWCAPVHPLRRPLAITNISVTKITSLHLHQLQISSRNDRLWPIPSMSYPPLSLLRPRHQITQAQLKLRQTEPKPKSYNYNTYPRCVLKKGFGID